MSELETITYQQEAYFQLRKARKIVENKKMILSKKNMDNLKNHIDLAMEELKPHLGLKV